jgi:phosphoglycerate dehydrogenase-like enzyme
VGMKKFNRIAVVDSLNSNIVDLAREEIRKCSKSKVDFPINDPASDEETLKRIGNADCVLLSWKTPINKTIMEKCPDLKYIGVAATSLGNISLDEAKKRGITVNNVADYGDEATAEYIFAQLLILARGLEGRQWKRHPSELNEKSLGIIGLGAVGKQLALRALGFNMKVSYYQRTRNAEYERKGLIYKTLQKLLSESNILSIHVPKNTLILKKQEFELIPEETVLVNTSNGKTFDEKDFLTWVNKGKNFAIFDCDGLLAFPEIEPSENIIVGKQTAGRTIESKNRLSEKFIENLKKYLKEKV